ncbi:MAG: methionyl-tRNA formyltransferase [Parcubacteria group bacterium]|nr:methionyl-tRNA formyltransferase [Parcubacteria group bacterium]
MWAEKNKIETLQPEKLDSIFVDKLKSAKSDFFLVASYGKIIPEIVLSIHPHKTLNIHPSLLPKLRGASPIQFAILQEKETGVTIMEIDKEMDHGPIVAQEKVGITEWPPRRDVLEKTLAISGSKLLANILPKWLSGEIKPKPQNHEEATYTKKIEKTDGLVDLSDDPYENYKKIQSFYGWPGTYFFVKKDGKEIRVIIKDAIFKDGKLEIKRVLPEGKKETDWVSFCANGQNPASL